MDALITTAAVAVGTAAESNTSAWFALGGALAGVFITGTIALATAILNHRWQTDAAREQLRDQRSGLLRQERRETYRLYWSAWNHLIHQLREVEKQASAPTPAGPAGLAGVNVNTIKEARDAELEWRDAADALFLIAGPEAVTAAADHLGATEARIAAANEGRWESGEGTYLRLNEAMRKDIIDTSPL